MSYFEINENNFEVEYNDENNNSEDDSDDKDELIKKQNQDNNNLENSTSTLFASQNLKNQSIIEGINYSQNTNYSSRNSELNNSNNVFYSHIGLTQKAEQKQTIEPKQKLLQLNNNIKETNYSPKKKEIINDTFTSNVNRNININEIEQNRLKENNIHKSISKLIMDDNKNKFHNTIFISENDSFINYIINTAINFNLRQNKKICYLTPDTKRAQDIYELFKNKSDIKSILLQKGKNRKNKNDLQSFLDQLNQNNLFIIIPNILYKLLSIGFVKFSDFGLIIFEECHLCEANYPYNIIMQEFYFYYFNNPSEKVNSHTLPNILGLTQSPFKDKVNIKNEKKGLEILKNISENLDSQIVVDPNIFERNKNINEDNINLIGIKSIFEQKNKIDGINILLMKYFFEPMIDFCLDDYLKINGDKKELNQFNKNDVKKKYLSVLKEKFSKENLEEYINLETSERSIHFLSQNSSMFKAFEDMQRMLFNIILNVDLKEFYYLFDKYKELYENNLNNLVEKNDNIYLQKFYKKLIYLFTINKKVFDNLINKNIEYKTDRLNKFMYKLNEIYNKNKSAKTLICVNNRKMIYLLYNYLNRDIPQNLNYKNKTHFIVGSNTKKEENSNLTISIRITTNEINERKKDYNENKINILICTIPGLEYLTKEKCDNILVFSEIISTNNDLEKIKEKAKNSNANLFVFSFESKLNNFNSFNKSQKESDNNINNNNQLKKFFYDNDNKLINPINYITKNYIRDKHLEKNFYYHINITEAKMSLKNCMLLFNEINNFYISKNIKMNIKKKIIEINNEQKFKCQCDFQIGNNNNVQIESNKYNDKQSAESECFMRYVIYLHKSGLIDDNFRVKM